MARNERSEFIVERTDYYYDEYKGTAAALVREGIVEAHQLPGQPGRGKTRAAYWPDGTPVKWGSPRRGAAEPGARQIFRIGVDRFRVILAVSVDEQKKRHAIGVAQRRKPAALAQARAELAEMTTTPQQYRERCLTTVDALLGACRHQFTARDKGAFCIDAQSLAAFDQAAAALLSRVRSMGITYSAALRGQRAASICAAVGTTLEEVKERQEPTRHLTLVGSRQ